MSAGRVKRFHKHWILTIGILSLLGMVLAYDLYLEHRRTESVEDDRLQVQARVIDENLSHQLVATYRSLQRILGDLPQWRAGASYKPAANLMLKTLEEAIPGVRTFIIIDAQGIARASNRQILIGRNFSQRAYFQTVRRHPDAATMYLSPPYTTVLNAYVMTVSRMIPGPKGEFSGIIVAALDPEYFRTLLSSVRYAPDMWVAISHGDGKQFMTVPDRDGQAEKIPAQPGSFFSRHRESGRKASILSETVDAAGDERVLAVRTILPAVAHLDKPLVVAVGRDVRVVFADWRRNAMIYVGVFCGIVLITVFSLRYNQISVQQAEERARISKEALEKSERRYRILAENTTDVVWQLDLQSMRFTYVSPSVFRLRGYTAEEVMAQPLEASLTPDSLRNVQTWMGRILEEFRRGKTVPHVELKEVEQPRKNGTTVWTEVSTTYVLDDKNQPVSVIGISRDITKRKHIEEERYANEIKFRTVFENSIDAIGVSRAGVHVFVNTAYAALFGYSTPGELVGKPVLELIVPAERATIQDRIQRRAHGEAVSMVYESKGLRQDGSEFVMDVHASTYELFGEMFTLVIMRDITERKRAEEELRESSELLRTFMNAIDESAFLMDREGRILAANETVAKRFGKTVQKFIGLTVDQILPPEVTRIRKKHAAEVVRTKKPVRFEDERMGRVIDNSIYPVFNAQGEVGAVAIVGYDVTDRKLAEEAIQQNEKKLRDITASLGEGLYVLNDRGEVTFMNPEAERLLGWTEDELRHRNIHNAIHSRKPDGSPLSFDECKMHNVIQLGTRFFSHNQMFMRKDGTLFPASVISTPLKENDRVTASITVFRDISDIKQVEGEREKLITDLQKALAEIKTLHGILPICSSCKKIRDDKGSWHQMEAYILDHTDAEFSHGLCADCAKKLYPEYYKEEDSKDKGRSST